MRSRRAKLEVIPLPERPPTVDGLLWDCDTVEEEIDWLIPSMLIRNSLMVIQGRTSTGKSTLMAALAASITGGPALPGWNGPTNGKVAWCSPEEHWPSMVLPRLKVAGCPAGTVAQLRIPEGGGKYHGLRLPGDIPTLRKVLEDGGAKLLVIDPYGSALGPGLNENLGQHVRLAYEPLLDLLWELEVTCVVSQHPRKGTSGDVTEQGSGSGAIVQLARSTIRLDKHPHERQQFLLSLVAGNFGEPLQTQVYKLRPEAKKVATMEWLGVSDLDADTIAEGRGSEAERDEWNDADRLLMLAIGTQWVNVGQLLVEADRAGISPRMLRRAKARLRIPSRKASWGKDGYWEWGPPQDGWPEELAATNFASEPAPEPAPEVPKRPKRPKRPRKSRIPPDDREGIPETPGPLGAIGALGGTNGD